LTISLGPSSDPPFAGSSLFHLKKECGEESGGVVGGRPGVSAGQTPEQPVGLAWMFGKQAAWTKLNITPEDENIARRRHEAGWTSRSLSPGDAYV
jgi:hypothetical protein